jgi:hypothetical protein
MSDEPTIHEESEEPARDGDMTRRRFVAASGVAIGAAIIWSAPFPFADAAIGQVLRSGTVNGGVTGAAGTTGASGTTGSSGTSGPSGATTPPPPATGTSGASGPPSPAGRAIIHGLERITHVRRADKWLGFTQDFAEPGEAHWTVFLRFHLDDGRRFRHVPIGSAHRQVRQAGEHAVRVQFSRHGVIEYARRGRADLALDTVFVDSYGRRFASVFVLLA